MRSPASYRPSEHSLALTICQSFNKFKRILGVSCFSFMKSCCLVVQFSKSFDRPFCGGPYIISLPLPPCQPPFFIFFNFFSRLTHLIRSHPHPVFIPWTPAGASGSVISSDGMRRSAAILAPIGKKTTPIPHGRGIKTAFRMKNLPQSY